MHRIKLIADDDCRRDLGNLNLMRQVATEVRRPDPAARCHRET
jgi:hypothetical protein